MRREFDEPDAFGIVVQYVGRDLQRQPRLAQAADAEQRQQPRFAQQSLDFGQLRLAADE